MNDIAHVTEFLHTMQNLKNLLRFKGMPGWENNTLIQRWDSVAEHSYRMALMAVLYYPYIDSKPNLEKTLKMILVHDIVELVANDYSPMKGHNGAGGHAFDANAYKDKFEREGAAAQIIFSGLPGELKNECISLWREYAETKIKGEDATPEGRYAYALDKLEATMQIVDWGEKANEWNSERTEKSFAYAYEWSKYDKTLSEVCQILKSEMKKIEK